MSEFIILYVDIYLFIIGHMDTSDSELPKQSPIFICVYFT